jgi:serine/threonine-protein kinase
MTPPTGRDTSVTPLLRLREALKDRYAVEREIGRGGMATVFLARDLEHERTVAIKVLHPDLAAALGAERFKREIQIATSLKHPNILSLYDSGEADGALYFVMPFVEGESLRARLDREHQLPLDDAIRIACEVATALDFACHQGFVHRDIKPENILLKDGHAIVADFGIARAISRMSDQAVLTQTGVTLGTPTYMSPEQALADKNIDGRSDIYSLGCVVYEMIAGQTPFTGKTGFALLAQHMSGEVPSLTMFRKSVPPELEDAIYSALAKSPADRYATAGQFAEALTGLRAPTMSRRAVAASRATELVDIAPTRKPAPPRRLVVVAAALALVSLGGAGWWAYSARARRAAASAEEQAAMRHIAVLYFTSPDTGELATLADGLTDALIERLRPVQGIAVTSRNAVAPFRSGSVSTDSIARALNVGTIVRGKVREDGDKLRADFGLVDASGVELETGTVAMPRGDLLRMRDSLAERVAAALRSQLGVRLELSEAKAGASNAQVWAFFERAKRARRVADSLTAAGDTSGAARALGLADSLALRTIDLDRGWVAPLVLRAQLAQSQVERYTRDPMRARPWIDSTVARAERALAIDPRSADALELRGTARFARIDLGFVDDKQVQAAVLDSVEKDLLEAVSIAPQQATAWNTLSLMQYRRLNVQASYNDALKAYEADAFLGSASRIIWRLFATSFDGGTNFPEAQRWCDEGERRFGTEARFAECHILLMLSPAVDPNVSAAWRWAAEVERRAPQPDREYAHHHAQMRVAGVLARAGLADSARHVIERARAGPAVDPRGELMGDEALVRSMLGDKDIAIGLIERYLSAHPEHRAGFRRANSWMWEGLRTDPRFKRITALGG